MLIERSRCFKWVESHFISSPSHPSNLMLVHPISTHVMACHVVFVFMSMFTCMSMSMFVFMFMFVFTLMFMFVCMFICMVTLMIGVVLMCMFYEHFISFPFHFHCHFIAIIIFIRNLSLPTWKRGGSNVP